LEVLAKNLLLYEGFENVPIVIKARIFHYLAKRSILFVEEFTALLDPEQSLLDLSSISDSLLAEHV
jgi:hypothetical protein